jgi:hypothetical protein
MQSLPKPIEHFIYSFNKTMFRPTHKSVVPSEVDTLPLRKPIRKQGDSDREFQSPNYKSETLGAGFNHTKPFYRSNIRNKNQGLAQKYA